MEEINLRQLLCQTMDEYCSQDNYGTGKTASTLKKF